MKTIQKCTDIQNQVEAKIIETAEGYALIVRDLDSGELVTRVNSEDIGPILLRFNKFQANVLGDDIAYAASIGAFPKDESA